MSLLPAAGRSLTVKQAAEFIGISEEAVRRMIRLERIDFYRTGERYGYRIPAGEVERLAAARGAGKILDAGGNAWLAQARILRESIRQDLEDANEALRVVARKTASALQKLDEIERESGR